MNAIAHAVEGLYAPDAAPIVEGLAEEAIRLLAAALPDCVDCPADLAARTLALRGAWLAGLALGNATMGIHHKLCHVLGGRYGLPHGETHACLLPDSVVFNADAVPDVMRRIAGALGAGDGSAALALWELGRRLGTPASLGAVGFDPVAVDEAAALVCAAAPVNSRLVVETGIRELLVAACAGGRSRAYCS